MVCALFFLLSLCSSFAVLFLNNNYYWAWFRLWILVCFQVFCLDFAQNIRFVGWVNVPNPKLSTQTINLNSLFLSFAWSSTSSNLLYFLFIAFCSLFESIEKNNEQYSPDFLHNSRVLSFTILWRIEDAHVSIRFYLTIKEINTIDICKVPKMF